jgi:transcriptional regulator with XRE-family HTH domain
MNHWQIQLLRQRMGLTQRQFAKVIGVEYWTVVKWENTVGDWGRQPNKSARVLLHQLLRWVPVVSRTNEDRDIPPRFLSFRFKGKIISFPF